MRPFRRTLGATRSRAETQKRPSQQGLSVIGALRFELTSSPPDSQRGGDRSGEVAGGGFAMRFPRLESLRLRLFP